MTISALWLFLAVLWVGLQGVIDVFPDHIYYFFVCVGEFQTKHY